MPWSDAPRGCAVASTCGKHVASTHRARRARRVLGRRVCRGELRQPRESSPAPAPERCSWSLVVGLVWLQWCGWGRGVALQPSRHRALERGMLGAGVCGSAVACTSPTVVTGPGHWAWCGRCVDVVLVTVRGVGAESALGGMGCCGCRLVVGVLWLGWCGCGAGHWAWRVRRISLDARVHVGLWRSSVRAPTQLRACG